MTATLADELMKIALPEQLQLITPKTTRTLDEYVRENTETASFVPTDSALLGTFRTPLDVLADDDIDAGHFFQKGGTE